MEIKNYIGEVWRLVKGFEGFYEVSNFGRVRSLDREIIKHSKNGKLYSIIKKGSIMVLYQNKKRGNYMQVHLSKNGELYHLRVHRLVAEAFIPNPYNKPDVDHIDGDPTNNNVNNLRWCTKSENMRNPITQERFKKSIDREARSERMKGDKNPSRRFPYTEERCKAISERCKGKKHSPESREKMSKALKGKYAGSKSWMSKPVGLFKDGVLIEKYGGMREAERETGISRNRIRNSIDNNKKADDGTYWKCI